MGSMKFDNVYLEVYRKHDLGGDAEIEAFKAFFNIRRPALVILFAYDIGAFVAESYRPQAAPVTISVRGAVKRLRNIATGEVVSAGPIMTSRDEAPRTTFAITLPPHSYAAFKVEQ